MLRVSGESSSMVLQSLVEVQLIRISIFTPLNLRSQKPHRRCRDDPTNPRQSRSLASPLLRRRGTLCIAAGLKRNC